MFMNKVATLNLLLQVILLSFVKMECTGIISDEDKEYTIDSNKALKFILGEYFCILSSIII